MITNIWIDVCKYLSATDLVDARRQGSEQPRADVQVAVCAVGSVGIVEVCRDVRISLDLQITSLQVIYTPAEMWS